MHYGKIRNYQLYLGKLLNSKTHPGGVEPPTLRFQAQCFTTRLKMFLRFRCVSQTKFVQRQRRKNKKCLFRRGGKGGGAKYYSHRGGEQKFCWSTENTHAPRGTENTTPKESGAGKCNTTQPSAQEHPAAEEQERRGGGGEERRGEQRRGLASALQRYRKYHSQREWSRKM